MYGRLSRQSNPLAALGVVRNGADRLTPSGAEGPKTKNPACLHMPGFSNHKMKSKPEGLYFQVTSSLFAALCEHFIFDWLAFFQ
jgi:hypothetical protein